MLKHLVQSIFLSSPFMQLGKMNLGGKGQCGARDEWDGADPLSGSCGFITIPKSICVKFSFPHQCTVWSK